MIGVFIALFKNKNYLCARQFPPLARQVPWGMVKQNNKDNASKN